MIEYGKEIRAYLSYRYGEFTEELFSKFERYFLKKRWNEMCHMSKVLRKNTGGMAS